MVRVRNEREAVAAALCVHMGMQTEWEGRGRGIGIGEWQCGREGRPFGQPYRVTMVVVHLGWVDQDLGSSLGWWAATAATYCPTGGWNIANLSQHNPGA